MKNKTRMPAITISTQHYTGDPSHCSKARKRKGVWIGKEKRKFSLFTDCNDNVHLKIQSDLFDY